MTMQPTDKKFICACGDHLPPDWSEAGWFFDGTTVICATCKYFEETENGQRNLWLGP